MSSPDLRGPTPEGAAPRRPSQRQRVLRTRLTLTAAATLAIAAPALALLPPWLQHTVADTAAERALFRVMALPGVSVLFPRPPAESVTELSTAVTAAPTQADLLLLRAHQEEAALDLPAAQRDLEAYLAHNPADLTAHLALADFFHRRAALASEFSTLLDIASLPPTSAESFQPPQTQAAWQALERALRLATAQSLPASGVDTLWQHWLTRYPQQSTVYARAFTWNLNQHRDPAAQAILDRYRQAFPSDTVFPVKAAALLVLAHGDPDAPTRALALYDTAFQPLWPQDLLNSYFDLLASTHATRRFVADAESRLQHNPEDLDAAARLFLFHRHNNHPELALAVLDTLRRTREQHDPSGQNWSPDDLDTLAQLCTRAQLFPEAARFHFALYQRGGTLKDHRTAQEVGLVGMISLLLTAPDQPIALGSANLGLYRDIATLDSGPGLWNGILSLWLNDGNLTSEFADQESRAQPYFHRRAAAALLVRLDTEQPSAPERPALHAQLLEAFASYGEDPALLEGGEHFLASYPQSPQRTAVALAMADADARARNTTAEFALYDRLLNDLAHATGNMPLSAAALASQASPASLDTATSPTTLPDTATPDDPEDLTDPEGTAPATPTPTTAFQLDTGNPTPPPNPDAVAYAQVLDRYLGRLTATNQLPQALTVLRRELDRNPNDPRLYERLADFLAQNNLSAQQEEVYRTAIAKFSKSGDTSWYNKLARFYLRQKRRDAFAALTKQVTGIFSGTDLEAWFGQVHEGGPQLFLALNLYAHNRFPHDLVFTRNLLDAYTAKPTANRSAWEHLLRQSWWQSPELTTQFFAWLSQTGQLDQELARLDAQPEAQPGAQQQPSPNTAALTELAQAHLWQSHFEQSSPLFDRLAALYPTDIPLGTTAADLNRSLAWLDPAGPAPHIGAAVGIEQHLLAANATDQARLIRIGDILADHGDGTRAAYAPAAAFWRRVPAAEPGNPNAYLDAATVFWDYFQFDDALDQLNLARTHLHNPTLFGYERAVLLEDRHDPNTLPAAIAEYTRAALAPTDVIATAALRDTDRQTDLPLHPTPDLTGELTQNPAADRLLQLARRPATAALVDRSTAAALDATPTLPALRLRLAVLHAQQRRSEEHPLLLAAITRASTPDAAADLAAFAQAQADTSAYEAALEREAALTPDPVEKLQLTYDRVRSLEARHDLAGAVPLVDATYRANPRVLGVVRFTVDFDWSKQRQPEAVRTLLEAAHAAQPTLARSFIAEAAAKANESGDWRLGRSLADTLLAADPYDPQFLALAAESYTRAGDLTGLQTFYRTRLAALQSPDAQHPDAQHPALSPDERRTHTAQLRRGLIPALVAANNLPAALDQYIALISAFPDDTALIHETALFALRYHREDQLRSFYLQTTQASPRDARFFIALAQTEILFGNTAGALTAYTHAVALRPERADLYIARASLEERQQRFDAAIADYNRLFQLSYKDPQWMLAAAQAEARQGHAAAAVQALQTAYLHAPQTTPHDLFTIAAQLEQWAMLPEAVTFAQRGAKLAGPDLLAGQPPTVSPEDATTYARILTRARQTAEAFTTLHTALTGLDASPSSPATLGAQVRSTGLASVTDAEWRRQYVHARQQRAQAQLTNAVLAMGETVATYGTPEDRAGFATALSAQRLNATPDDLIARWIPAAHAAGLAQLEASWRAELLNSNASQSKGQLAPYIALQQARLQFAELAAQLDRYARLHPRAANHSETVQGAADAYAAAGQTAAELHLFATQRLTDPANAPLRDPYLALLAHTDTNALLALARNPDEALADAAIAEALAAAPANVALATIRARGNARPPVWTAAYTGLAGLYLGDRSPAIDAAFRQALQPDLTVADRLAHTPDTTRQFAGDPWFYYAGRYAQWRLLTTDANPSAVSLAEDLLPADLEHAPTLPNFLALAQTEAEAGLLAPALADTAHALELEPDSVDALNARASLLWQHGDKPQAIDSWRLALNSLHTAQTLGSTPESFWTDFARIAVSIHQHALFTALRPSMRDLLQSYLARNGNYRSNELLQAALDAAPDQATGLSFVLALAAAAPDPALVLADLANNAKLTPSAQQQLLATAFDRLNTRTPNTLNGADTSFQLAQVRSRLLRLYLQTGQDAQALALIQNTPDATRATPEFLQAELIASARAGQLPSLLKTLDAQPAPGAPSDATPLTPELIRAAAATLANGGNWPAARTLLSRAYTRAQDAHTLTSPDVLSLADAQLHTGDTAAAVDLLRTLVETSQTRYPDEDAAAALLEAAHQPSAAVPFLHDLASSVPWDLSYTVRLAEAQLAAAADLAAATQSLTLVAKGGLAPYALRARAANDLGTALAQAVDLGSPELNLLGSAKFTPTLPALFVEARLAAAAHTESTPARLQLLREAIAIAPNTPEAGKLRFQLFRLLAANSQPAQAAFTAALRTQLLAEQDTTQPAEPPARLGVLQYLPSSAGSDTTYTTPLPLYAQLLPPPEQATVAEEVAATYSAQNDLATAHTYLELAQHLAANDHTRTAHITAKLDHLDAQLRLAAANAARRPAIRKDTDQPGIVRVRLTPTSDPARTLTAPEHTP